MPDLRRDVLGTLERARRERGDVVRLLAGPPRLRNTLFAIFHPDGVRHVLAAEADAYRKDNRFYREMRWALGDGLLNSQDERWLRQRRFVQPLFTRHRIAGYAEAMGEEAESLAAALERAGSTVDLHARCPRSPCASSAGCCSAPTSGAPCRWWPTRSRSSASTRACAPTARWPPARLADAREPPRRSAPRRRSTPCATS